MTNPRIIDGHYRKVRNNLVDSWVMAALQDGAKTVDQIANCIGSDNTEPREIRCRLHGLEVRGVVVRCKRLFGKHETRWMKA